MLERDLGRQPDQEEGEREVKAGFSELEVSERRPEGQEGASPEKIWWKEF